MITFQKLQPVKMMITQVDVYQIAPISSKLQQITIETTKTTPGSKAVQQINFSRNLNRAEDATKFFIIEEVKKKKKKKKKLF